MPRRRCTDTKGIVFHAMNRGAKRARLFDTAHDYAAFERLLIEAKTRIPLLLFAYCLMPNHWHFVLRSLCHGDVSRFLHWFTGTHARRWNAFRHCAGSGAVYQGRFKANAVQADHHLLRVIRYVERNPLRANLVTDAADWRWSSLWRRRNFCDAGLLDPWPIPQPADWLSIVNQPDTEGELDSLRVALTRSSPIGDDDWRTETAKRLGIECSLRPIGRPRRQTILGANSALAETTPDLVFPG
jgi:REP-associated tyrosine transposase